MESYDALIAELRRQEEELQFDRFTNDTAMALGLHMAETAKREGKPVAINICRNGQLLFHVALPGTSADNDAWIRRKSNVVNRYGHSSYLIGTEYRAKGTTFEEKSRLDPAEYAAHGGSFPLIIRHVGPVGTITVSGLPQLADHEFLVRTVREFLAGIVDPASGRSS